MLNLRLRLKIKVKEGKVEEGEIKVEDQGRIKEGLRKD